LELRLGSNGPTKMQGLLWHSRGPGARDYLAAKIGAKAVGGFPKYKVYLGSSLGPKLIESHNVSYKEGGLPSSFPMVIVVIKGVPGLVWLVLELYHGDSYTLGSRLSGQTPKGFELSLDGQRMLPNGGSVPTSGTKGPE
jgi:hypothetical protein